jgi:hypothetical protein
LDLDLGLCNIGHPEIAFSVILSLIAKRGSQTSFKKSALLSSRALFSYHFKQITSSKACAVEGSLFQAGLRSATFWVLK